MYNHLKEIKIMAKKTTAPTAPEHAIVTPLRGNQVRLTADQDYLLRSRRTGNTSQSVVTAHVAGYEVVEVVKEEPTE